MSRLLAIAAILLSLPASAQLNDANLRPYMTFKLFVDGVEVPVTPTGEGTQCGGGSCDFTTPVITQGRDVSVRFIPEVERDELGANNFSLNSLALQGATLENLTNLSPDNWHGRGAGFNPDTTKGVEWAADLIPTPGAEQQSLDITIKSTLFFFAFLFFHVLIVFLEVSFLLLVHSFYELSELLKRSWLKIKPLQLQSCHHPQLQLLFL